MSEIFKDIVGYEGLYQIGDHGSVLALERTVINKKGNAQRYPAKFLKFDLIQRNHTNYLRVTLCKNHSTKRFQVHRLVALHFVDNPAKKPHINHIDNCGTNNHYSNLEWCTPTENMLHSSKQGRQSSVRSLGGIATSAIRTAEMIKKTQTLLGNRFVSVQTNGEGNHARSYITFKCSGCHNTFSVRSDSAIIGRGGTCRYCYKDEDIV